MGFDDGKIVLDSPNGAYYTGQTVHGRLIFDQNKVKKFRGIYVKFVGFCKVHWTTTESRRVDDRDVTYTVVHESYEEYCNMKIYLVGGESGDHHIQPGHYDYPFVFQIPGNCPSTYEGEYGHVRYEIKIVVDKAFQFDQKKTVELRVIAPLDLNQNPYCKEPLEMELNDVHCCCCFSSGSTDTVVNAPLSGYCPGQKISLEVTSANKGTVEIDTIKLRLKKKIVFTATSEPDTREEKEIIVEIKKGPIPGNTTRNWSLEMEVPAMDVYNLTGCSFISLTYKLEVVVSPDGCCYSDSDQSRQIIIGTIPLVGFQDDVVNTLQDQLPQPVAPITQQPLFSAVTSPYPHNNAPYPNNLPYENYQNPPYPVTSPQINSNPPYPTNDAFKSAYGTDNPPHPPSNSSYSANDASKMPYPSANPHYPVNSPGFINPPYPTNDAATSPYPSGNSPYLGGTPSTGINPPYSANGASKSPYPPASSPNPIASANPPYPNVTPFHDIPPPYPGSSSPFPTQKSPSQMGSLPTLGLGNDGRLLKTGNVGFVVQGSNTGNTPYPGPTTPLLASPATNPYLAASAPALDSPDIEKKE